MKTVLISSEAGNTPDHVIAALDRFEPDDKVAWILHLTEADRRASAQAPGSVLETPPGDKRPVYRSNATGRRYLVPELTGANLNQIGRIVMQQIDSDIDFLCLFTEAKNFNDALTQIERSVLALSPQVSLRSTEASYQYFSQLFEKLVKPYADGPDVKKGANPYEAIWENVVERVPGKAEQGREEPEEKPLLEVFERDTLIATRPNQFATDAADFGLKFVPDRVLVDGTALYMKAENEELIVIYGPDRRLVSGRYIATFGIDTTDENTFADSEQSEIVLRVDVVLEGGAHSVLDQRYYFDVNSGEQEIIVPFEIPEDFGSGVSVETRLWVVEGTGMYLVRSYTLEVDRSEPAEDMS